MTGSLLDEEEGGIIIYGANTCYLSGAMARTKQQEKVVQLMYSAGQCSANALLHGRVTVLCSAGQCSTLQCKIKTEVAG